MTQDKKIEAGKSAAIVIVLFGAAIIALAALVSFDGQITGMASLNTFESELFIAGASSDNSLSFEQIPNFVAKTGEHIRFNVEANRDDVTFRDDTNLFDITPDGIVDFTPSEKDIGKHNVWIIIKDNLGNYYYQNVVIIIEE